MGSGGGFSGVAVAQTEKSCFRADARAGLCAVLEPEPPSEAEESIVLRAARIAAFCAFGSEEDVAEI